MMHSVSKARRRTGFTLIELLVSVAIISVIMTALGSVVVLTSRALPSDTTGRSSELAAALALEQIAEELRFATRILETTPATIAFAMPDRTGNGQPELVRYEWTGPGRPLQRSLNGGNPVTIVESLYDFAFEFHRRVHETTDVTTDLVSEERLLSSFTGWAGITPTVGIREISSLNWLSQRFVIDDGAIPPDASAWRITRISMRMRQKGSLGSAAELYIYHPNTPGGFLIGPEPIGTPALIPSSAQTTSWGWRDAVFDDIEFTDPAIRELIILVRAPLLYATHVSEMQFLSSTQAPNTSDYIMQWTTDGGLTWLPTTNRHRNRAPYFVYGEVDFTTAVTTVTTRYTLAGVTIAMQSRQSDATRVTSAVQLLNDPETPDP